MARSAEVDDAAAALAKMEASGSGTFTARFMAPLVVGAEVNPKAES